MKNLIKNQKLIRGVGFGLLCLVITVLMTYSGSSIPKRVEVGMIAPRDIKADRNYEVVDEEATEKFRAEAIQNVFPVFDFDEEVGTNLALKVDQTFESIRNRTAPQGEAELKKFVEEQWNVTLSTAEWQGLLATRFSKFAAQQWGALLKTLFARWIVDDRKSVAAYQESGGVVVRRIRAPSSVKQAERETHAKKMTEILTTDEARQLVDKMVLPSTLRFRPVPAVLRGITQRMAGPNINFNRQETEARRDEAARGVKNIVIKLQTGESIIRSGARFEPWHMKVIGGIQREKSKKTGLLRAVGTFLFVALALGVTFYFSERFLKRFAPERQDYLFIGFIIITVLVIMRLSISLSGAVHDAFFYHFPTSILYYAIPVAGGVMMVRMVLSAEISLIVAVILSVLAGILIGSDINYTAYCLISSVAGGSFIARADHRSAILKAGILTGLVNALAVLGVHLIQLTFATRMVTMGGIGAHLLFAFAGGVSAGVFVLLVMPIVEFLFDYATDIKLLELANLNHPLLKELIVRAPGTYHHSHIVGVLAEAAAEAIGANPLLVRVGAYYHDIGKMKKPDYFTENMGEKENRHDALSPHMSALIIQSHVKDGIALGRMHKLPQAVIDMIPQHHGTKKISFFFEKAKELSDPAVTGEVEEKDFRYPGPKPQSREAGILMLADGVEAAVRSLKEKSPTRIQQTVEKIVDKSFIEAQLDECDLTLKDLHEIGKAFTRILIALYHQRIEYPQEESREKGSASATTPVDPNKPRSPASASVPNLTRLRFPHR